MISDLQDEFARAEKLARQSKTFDHQMQAKSVAAGNLTDEQISNILSHAQAHLLKQSGAENAGKNQSTKDALFLALLDHIEQLRQEIDDMERGFEVKYGDAWREELALKILDKDDIPQRRSDETIEAYRERLEVLLIEELLNDDGSIKDEYLNDKDMRKFAEWAQKNYNRDNAIMIAHDLTNPNNTQIQTQALIDKVENAKNSELNTYAARTIDGNEGERQAVLDVDEQLTDNSGLQEQSGFSQDFLKPIGS